MNDAALKSDTQDIVVDEVFPHAPETIWKTLTTRRADQPLAEMAPTGFEAVVGKRFTYQTTPAGAWDGVIHCEVLEVDAERDASSYAGRAATRAMSAMARGWTRSSPSPSPGSGSGTRVRLVHSGFVLPKNETAFRNMGEGWKKVVQRLGALAAEQD